VTDRNHGYTFAHTNDRLKATHERNRRPVKFGDVCYNSLVTAAKALGVSPPTVGRYIRLKMPINGLYGKYITKEEYREYEKTRGE
jgi:hypothetical protein